MRFVVYPDTTCTCDGVTYVCVYRHLYSDQRVAVLLRGLYVGQHEKKSF